MKNKKFILAAFIVLFLAAISGNTQISRAEEKKTAQVKAPLNLHVVKKSTTSLQLSWNLVEGAGGYEIYRCPAGKHNYKRVKVIKNPMKGVWLNKRLKKNKTYKYRIKAYAVVNGVKVLSKYAYTVSARTYTKNSKVVNVNLVKTDTYLLETDFGKTEKFLAWARTTKRKKKVVSRKIAWYSKNKDIATITKDGKLKAKNKAGVCYIYAKAHNGKNSKKIPVYVLDPSTPQSFHVEEVTGKAVLLLSRHKKEVCTVAKYFTGHRPSEEMDISYDKEEGWEIEPVSVEVEDILGDLKKIFDGLGDSLIVTADDELVTFTIEDKQADGKTIYHILEYYYDIRIDEYNWDEGYIEIADYWGYYSYEK